VAPDAPFSTHDTTYIPPFVKLKSPVTRVHVLPDKSISTDAAEEEGKKAGLFAITVFLGDTSDELYLICTIKLSDLFCSFTICK
jgi:hypothetical protein